MMCSGAYVLDQENPDESLGPIECTRVNPYICILNIYALTNTPVPARVLSLHRTFASPPLTLPNPAADHNPDVNGKYNRGPIEISRAPLVVACPRPG